MSRFSGGYHHGDLRNALVDAGYTLLSTRSPATLSLREVARAAGVSHNAPYHHFGDKTKLMHALAVRSMTALLEAQQAADRSVTDPGERMIRVCMAYVHFAVEQPNAFSLIFDPDVCIPGQPEPDMAPLIRSNEDLLAALVAAAVEAGVPIEAPKEAAAGLWGLAHGLAQLVMLKHLHWAAVEPTLRTTMSLHIRTGGDVSGTG